MELVGYFTLALKPLTVRGETVSNTVERKVTGAELLELAWNEIEKMQYMGGGMVTFLEADNKERLLAFYQTNRFQPFDTRQTSTGTEGSHELVQLLRLL
jgi:tRNA(Met) C34 N-acetyltransferase TmcA